MPNNGPILSRMKPIREQSEAKHAKRKAVAERQAQRVREGKSKAGPKELPSWELQPTHNHPETGEPLPPLIVAIEDIILWGGRTADCLKLADIYKVSKTQIHTVIRKVKDEWIDYMAKTRQDRVSKNARRLDHIIERASRAGDLKVAKDAIMDVSKLLGDNLPETHIMLGGDKDPEALLAQAEELRKLALASGEEQD